MTSDPREGSHDTTLPANVVQAATGVPDAAGMRIGPYKLLQVIGEGGFGVVHMAEQEHPIRRRVAVKILKLGMDTKEFIARFEAERQALALMDHPNIAKVLDAGATETGRPYFVMELVKGMSITGYCDANRLNIRERLDLFAEVCKATHHAHERGVVHRDIKPSNVMIALHDGAPVPKIIDFGVAKATNYQLTDKTLFTAYGEFIGTPAYMSPEQADMSRLEIDRRSDIYSLGVLLYELLTGTTPFEAEAFRSRTFLEVMRIIREEDPPTPSIRLSTLGERLIDVAGRRQVEPNALLKMLRGDLGWIVMKAIDKDRRRRYRSASDLADDVARYFHNDPVIARRPTAAYRLLKFARRRRGPILAAAGIAVAVVVGGLAGTLYTPNTPSAPSRQYNPVSVVIADIQNNTGDPIFDHNVLGHLFRRALEGATFISAYDRTRIPNLGLPTPTKLDEVAAREFAVKQAFGVVLLGSIEPTGDGYEILIKAIQPVTGRVLTADSVRVSNKNQVVETAAKVMATIRKRLGDETPESAQLLAMRSLFSTPLEVMNHYAAGLEAVSKGNVEDARKSLSLAVERDPNFGLGYQGLAAIAANRGQMDEAKKYIQEALRAADAMTEHERFTTRGAYYRFMADYANCAKEYGELVARYRADSIARVQRAVCLVFLRNLREAVDEMRQVVEMLPNHAGFRLNLALTAYRAGEFQLVEDNVKAMQQPDPRAVLALAYSQLGRGMPRDAAETYKKVAALDPRNTHAQLGLADVLVYEGRFSEAVPIFEQAAATDIAAKNSLRAAIKFLSAGNAHLQSGQNDLAAAAADRALQQSTVMAVKFLAAQVFVETGAIAKAQGLAAELSSSKEAADDSRVHGKIIEAQIVMKKKDPRQAIKILTDANGVLDTWLGHFNLGRAYLEAGEFVQADSEFDLCITRRGEALTVMDEGPTFGMFPIVYYYQGRIREELKTPTFADSYREYLKIRGASTEDPLVPEVRKRAGS